MPTFIKSLFEAAKIYFESINIASFNIDTFVNVIKYSLNTGSIASPEQVATILKCYERDLRGYLSLGWHLGVFSYVKRGKDYSYVPTKLAKYILNSCSNTFSPRCREFLSNLFLSWAPLRTLLKFIKLQGKFRV